MNARHVIVLLAIALLAGIGGAVAYRVVFLQPPPASVQTAAGLQDAAAEEMIGTQRPDYTLGSRSGERISAADFDGKVVLVNFWATWCKPCRKEMPMLVDLYHAHADQGFEVVGIALDDVGQAREFAANLGVDYSILVGSTDVIAVVRLYGNSSGVLPYSVLIDRDGVIRWTHLGELKKAELESRLAALLPLRG